MSTVLQCNWESQSLVRDLSFGGKIRSLLYRHLLKMRKLFIAPFPSHELRKRHLNSYGGIKVQQHPGDLVQAPAIFLTLSLTQLSSPQVCGWWASPPIPGRALKPLYSLHAVSCCSQGKGELVRPIGALHSAAGLSYWLDDCSAAAQLASLSKVLGEGFANYNQ